MEKLGAIEDADLRGRREPAAYGLEPLVVEPGGADDRVDAVADAVLEVVHHRVGVREVHGHLGAGGLERAEVVADVHLRHELEAGCLLDPAAHLGAHLAAGADDAHLDPFGHPPNLAGAR